VKLAAAVLIISATAAAQPATDPGPAVDPNDLPALPSEGETMSSSVPRSASRASATSRRR
jgi:hypothetical protein